MPSPQIFVSFVAIYLWLVACVSGSTGPELVTNGGFETGNFSGWSTTAASNGSLFGVSGEPHSGNFSAFFAAVRLFPDTIGQSIPTTPGALYQVSFWLKNDGAPPNEFRVDFGGNTLFDSFAQATFPYQQFIFPIVDHSVGDRIDMHYTVATSASTLLQVQAYHSPASWRLDDISVTRICDPDQTGSQQFFAPELPLNIPIARNGGDPLFRDQFVTGTGTIFQSVPQSNSASISVCLDDFFSPTLKVTIRPLGNAPDSAALVVWDHERFADDNGQTLPHIEALANLPFAGQFPDQGSNPPTYSYKVEVLDDQPGRFADHFEYIATFDSSVLTLNPTNPGHLGPPTVNLYADEMFHQIPLAIPVGDPLTVFATAIGNPSSYKINRLALRVKERVDIDPLNPDPNHLLLPYQQHNSGIGPGLYIQDDVAESPSSTTGVGSVFEPPDLPILPPGYYEVTATAWDRAGFTRTLTQHLTVNRSFGFLSVANLARQVNTSCVEAPPPDTLACNTANFAATLNLINNTPNDSGNLRIRLALVPGTASTDEDFFMAQALLPAERDMTATEASIGPVAPLPSCSAQQVQVCGLIPAPIQTVNEFGVGFQVYAVLEECDDTQTQCADPANSDLWIAVDTIRVTEGEWPIIFGFAGPGGGTNQDRRGGKGKNNPFVLDSVTIAGVSSVTGPATVQFRANATLKNSQGTMKQLTNVRARWSASMFSISSTGLFQPGQVTVPTPVTITATYTFAGVTKTQTAQVTVNPPAVAAARTGRLTHPVTPEAGDTVADRDSLDEDLSVDGVSARRKPKPAKPPNLTLSVLPTSVQEGGLATVTVAVNKANPTQSIVVNYTITGSALVNTHYTICGSPGQITIPPGATSASVRLTALANDQNVGSETAAISISPSTAYKLPRKGARATVTITNVAAPLCP